jgi:hypothetical protein
VLLLDVSPRVRAALLPILAAAGLEAAPDDGPPYDGAVYIIEADRGAGLLTITRELRRRAEGALVFALTGWWSDVEHDLKHMADAVLHVPLRHEEWREAAELVELAARSRTAVAR